MGHTIKEYDVSVFPLVSRKVILIVLLSVLVTGCASWQKRISDEKMAQLSNNSNSFLIITIPDANPRYAGGLKIKINNLYYFGNSVGSFSASSGKTYKLAVPDGPLKIDYNLGLLSRGIFPIEEVRAHGTININLDKNKEVELVFVKQGEPTKTLNCCYSPTPFIYPSSIQEVTLVKKEKL